MKTNFFRHSILVLGLVLMGAMPQAMAGSGGGVRFSIAGGVDYGLNSTAAGAGTVKGGLGYGGGVLIGFSLGAKVGFEVGGIYLQRKVEITGTGLFDGTVTSKAVNIPARFQFVLGSRVLLNAGGFYDYSLETGGTNSYGATGGLRFYLSRGFFFDAAYNQELKDNGGDKNKEVVGLVGVTF